MNTILEKLAKLLEVKSIVTITMTFVMAYLMLGSVQVQPELLALYSTSYGAIVTYFFTRKDSGQ